MSVNVLIKPEFILRLILLAGSFGNVTKAMGGAMFGDNLFIIIVKNTKNV